MTANSSIGQGNVLTGTRLRLELNGAPFGYATGVSVSDVIGYVPIAVLDQIEIVEHVPVSYDVSISASRLLIMRKSLQQLNLRPAWSATEGSEEFLKELITAAELSGQIMDRASDAIIARVEGVRIASQSFTIVPRGVVGQEVGMVARRLVMQGEL